MCQYCSEHGKGKKWFLNMQNHTKKLLSNTISKDRELIINDHVEFFRKGRFPFSRYSLGMIASMVCAKLGAKKIMENFMEKWYLGPGCIQ